MKRAIDHDEFVAKNRSLAVAEDLKHRDEILEKKGFSHLKTQQEGSCFNCKMKSTCSEFKARRSGRASGVVSFGGDQKFICDRFIPAPAKERSMSESQIKSLMKNFKKGY